MAILGISAHYHDSAAALIEDGVPVCAVQEERLTRTKNDAGFPMAAIEWCLDRAGHEPRDLEAVVFYEKPMLKFERILTMTLRGFPRSWGSFPRAMQNTLGSKLWVKGTIASELGVPGERILFTEHHRAHAAAAFFPAPTRRAAILTADGVGEWATLSLGRGSIDDDGQAKIELLRELRFPHSLGMLYSTFTAYLGFPVNEGEYKVMGLAAYGRPAFEEQVRRMVRRTPDGAFALDLSYFEFHEGARRSFSDRLVAELGPPRDPWDPLDLGTAEGARFADVARSVQGVLEEILVDLARSLHRETGLEDLCFGGGVALNGCANARILRESGFRNLYVPCAPGDAGCALGAALYADRLHFGRAHRAVPDHPYWGPEIDAGELARLAREDGLGPEELSGEAELVARAVEDLAAGRIVGWMQGCSELGPRALGNRSILAAPHEAAMRDTLNRSIKYREEFRPFAPAVPIEHAERFFELPQGGARLGRFMSGVFPVRPEWRARLPAVTHADGTARVQTVDRAMAPRFHALLEAYGARTGVPVLLNTSFNLAGEPIVNRAAEGYSTFRRSGIDVLVAGNVLVRKRRQAPAESEEAAP
jgi:carbamoyltransferase